MNDPAGVDRERRFGAVAAEDDSTAERPAPVRTGCVGDDRITPQQLAGAVLEGVRRHHSGTPALRFRHRIRRWRRALLKQTEDHPYASICVLVVLMALGFLMGVASTSLNYRAGLAQLRREPPGSTDSGPIAAVTPDSAEFSETHAGRPRASGYSPRRDLAMELIANVVDGDYTLRSDVATGRFLEDFDNQWSLLVEVDRTRLRLVRRGRGWVQLRGPCRPTEHRWMAETHLTDGNERWIAPAEAIIRMVEEERIWKLEHIRVE